MAEKKIWLGPDLIQLAENSEEKKSISMDELMSQLSEFEKSSQTQNSRTVETDDSLDADHVAIGSTRDELQSREFDWQKTNTNSLRGPCADRDFVINGEKKVVDIQPVVEKWNPIQFPKEQNFPNTEQMPEFCIYNRSREPSKEKEQPIFHPSPPIRQSDTQRKVEEPTFRDNEPDNYERGETEIINKGITSDDNCSILVLGPVSSIGEEMLRLVFESEKRSGGGLIDKLEIDDINEEAILTFEEEFVANRVLKKFENGPCVILDQEMFLKKYIPTDFNDDDQPDTVLLKISNISPKATQEYLHLFFENKRKSGGSDVKNIEFNSTDGCCVIEFEDSTVVDQILKNFEENPCVILDKEVFLEKYSPNDDLSDRISPHPVLLKVSNFSSTTTQEHLHLFFESKRKSGGDDVKTIEFDANDRYCLIEFEDSTVIDQIFERHVDQPLMLDGTELFVERYVRPPPSEMRRVNKLLRVIGIPSGITEEAITFYFEDYKKYGGDHIESIDYEEEIGVAKIKYEDDSVVNRVLERAKYRPIRWQNHLLTLDSVDEEKDNTRLSFNEEETLSMLSSMSGKSSSTSSRITTALLRVSGLPSTLSTDLIQCFFENTRRVGGGDIENIDRDVDGGTALIKFKNVKVIDQILKKFKDKTLTLDGSLLSIEKYHPEIQEDHDGRSDRTDKTVEEPVMPEQPCYLKVIGLPSEVSKDTVVYFFENTRRSGGDEIKNIQWETLNEGYVLLQFEDETVVDRVVAKSQQSPLQLDERTLSVSKYIPPPPKPVDPMKLFLSNINPSTTKDCLLHFVEAKSDATPVSIEYSEDKQSALLSFTEKPNFEMLAKSCVARKLEEHHLTVEKVPISNSVMVSNISSNTSKDTIEFYFENKKRSNGGPVEKLEFYPEKGFAVVYFEDSAVANAVCETGRKHTIDGQELNVSLHHECLGETKATKPKSSEEAMSPKKVKVTIDAYLLLFLLRVPQAKSSFRELLQDNMAKLERWPEEKDPTLIIVCDGKLDTNKAISDWSTSVKAKLATFFSKLDIETVSTYQEISRSPEFKSELSKIKAENAAMFVKDNALNIVGQKESVKKIAIQVKAMFKTLEEKLKSKNEETVKDISLQKYQLQLLLSKNFNSSHVKKLFPDVEFFPDFKKGKVTFRGLIELIQKAEAEMYRVINSYHSKTMPMTDQSKKLLFENEVRKVIKKKMDDKKVIGVWHANQHMEKVTVYSDSDHNVDKAIGIIKNTIIETSITLPGDSKAYMQSKEWSEVQAQLNKMKPKLSYQIDCDWNKLQIAVTDDQKDSAVKKIKTFLQNKSCSEKIVPIGKGKFRFLKEHKATELDELKEKLKQRSIFLHPSQNANFKISGPSDGFKIAEESLNKLVKDIKMLHLKFKKVDLKGFFNGRKGRDLIGDVKKKKVPTATLR